MSARGRLMAREADRSPGGLLALLDGSAAAIARAVAAGSPHGPLAIAAWNAPDEIVLTGAHAALVAAATVFPSRLIPASGAWHSPAMAGSVEERRAALHAARSRARSSPTAKASWSPRTRFPISSPSSSLTPSAGLERWRRSGYSASPIS